MAIVRAMPGGVSAKGAMAQADAIRRYGANQDFAGGSSHRLLAPKRPESELEALMACAPGDTPEDTWEDVRRAQEVRWEVSEQIALRVRSELALSHLSPMECEVSIAVANGKTIRETAQLVGVSKSEVHRIVHRVKPKLKLLLADLASEVFGKDMHE